MNSGKAEEGLRGGGVGAWLGLAAVLLLAFGLRLYASVVAYASTFDTATVGLMALNILEGDRPLFFYGQSYMGSLEAYLAAGLFRLFGASELMLSMSPILFSLAWITATFLLFRDLLGTKVALAAALCVAIPSWETLWYCIGSYGGYPAAFFFGTTGLWLCVRIAMRDPQGRSLWAHAAALGLAAGLGLWTHYIALAYLLPGAVVLAGWFARKRFAARILPPFLLGGLLFLAAFSPVLVSLERAAGETVVQWHLSTHALRAHVEGLFVRPVPAHLFGSVPLAAPVRWVVVLALLGASILYAVVVVRADRGERRRLLLPALAVGLFLVLYLPHDMAATKVPRYIIPMWLMLEAAVFALPLAARSLVLRQTALLLLGLRLVFHGAADIQAARLEAGRKQERIEDRERVVANAARAGITNAVIVGGSIDGHGGQILSFTSGNRVHFVSAFEERYQPSALAAEIDPNAALACTRDRLGRVKTALDNLGASYEIVEDPWINLVHRIRLQGARRRSVAPAEMKAALIGRADGLAAALVDRDYDTEVDGPFERGSGFVIDLGRRVKVDGFWLDEDRDMGLDLPVGYTVSVSRNGRDFQEWRRTDDQISPACACGNGVYLKGYFGMLEGRYEPVMARYVRFEFIRGQKGQSRWRVSEVMIFEHLGKDGPVADSEVEAIASAIRERRTEFTIADRWLSGRLLDRTAWSPDRPPAYPRFNPRYAYTRIPRILEPGDGQALAIPAALADECEALVRKVFGDSVSWERVDFGHYAVLFFRGTPSREDPLRELCWNGHMLLVTKPGAEH